MDVKTADLKEYEFNKEFFENLPRGDYDALKNDVAKRGIKTELHILPDKTVICGHQRLRVARDLKLESVPCKTINGLDTPDAIKEYVIKDNLLRRHLAPEQRAQLEYQLYKMHDVKVGRPKQEHNVPISDPVYDKLAKDVGQSRMTIVRHIQYAKEVEKHPELKGKKVMQVLRQVKIQKDLANIKSVPPKLPDEKKEYNVIVIDPPWPEIGPYDPDGFRGTGNYPTMPISDIKKIKLPAAKDCVLWLWGIDFYLKETLEVIEAWGFERKSTLIWVKDKIGLGHWLRNQHEYCFVCVKGKPVFHGESVSTILHAPRRAHSEKPTEFYTIVEKISPYPNRLDYFARKKREGWDVFGNEI